MKNQRSRVGEAQWTPLHQKAADALSAVIAAHGLDDALRVAADVLGPPVKGRHLKLRKLTVSARADPYTFAGGRPPSSDHPEVLLRDGKPSVFVSQPYGLGHDELKALLAWADERKMEVHVDACGWYFFGRALRVEIGGPGAPTHFTVANCI